MRLKYLLVISFCVSAATGYPCGNSYHHSGNAAEYESGARMETFRFRRSFSSAGLLQELNRITDEINSRLNLFENENDKALTYMRMGRHDEALAILKKLEQEKPGEYNVIANLGTLYELMGDNRQALNYIRKAMSIDAHSHHGSEWLHIRVLEAKMLKKEASWWKTHTILNLAEVRKPAVTITGDIVYQLKERLPFTKAPDEMMAAVLIESGDFLTQQGNKQQAWILYKIAGEYDAAGIFEPATKTAALENYFSANGMALPDYESHFISREDLVKSGTDLLNKGLGIYEQYQQRERERIAAAQKKKNWYRIAVGIVVAALGIFLYLSLRKK